MLRFLWRFVAFLAEMNGYTPFFQALFKAYLAIIVGGLSVLSGWVCSVLYTRMGCDYGDLMYGLDLWRFNPRTRMGCDELKDIVYTDMKSFNPRTRMGCDSTTLKCKEVYECFNPRTRVGCDFHMMKTY